jgi:hypothetical protein
MKNLHRLRGLGLDREVLIATEITRTLVWVANRTKDGGDDEEKKKFNKMIRFLIKEYKTILGLAEKTN